MSELTIEHSGSVAVIALNSPKQGNALGPGVVRALDISLSSLEADGITKSVVLTGVGRIFCAGAELQTLLDAANGDFEPVKVVYDGFLRVMRSPLPIIAAVNGSAVGAGLNLALACDVRLASESARFDTRFAQLHIHPGGGHAWLLARAVGQEQATLACLFGEVWDAAAAHQKGLVASVHPPSELLDAAIALGQRLDRLDGDYVRRVVATLRRSAEIVRHVDALEQETRDQEWSTTLPQFRQGIERMSTKIFGTPHHVLSQPHD